MRVLHLLVELLFDLLALQMKEVIAILQLVECRRNVFLHKSAHQLKGLLPNLLLLLHALRQTCRGLLDLGRHPLSDLVPVLQFLLDEVGDAFLVLLQFVTFVHHQLQVRLVLLFQLVFDLFDALEHKLHFLRVLLGAGLESGVEG